MGYKKQPKPVVIEASSLNELLETGKNLDDYEVRRKWSFYKLVDCVDFVDRNVINLGSYEFAADYGNYVFVFSSENNLKSFTNDPRKYISRIPLLEGQVNISVNTPDDPFLK